MDTTEPINSDSLIDRYLSQNTRIEKDVEYEAKNILQQSLYEDKLANNGLTVNIFIHCMCLLIVLLCFCFDIKLLKVRIEKVDRNMDYVTLDLFDFNIYFKDRNKMSFSYFCILNYEDATTSPGENKTQTCSVDAACSKLNVTELALEFDIWCSQLSQLKITGIVYAVLISSGTLLGIVSAIMIVLLLCNVIDLEKCERIRNFTKFEIILYFLGFSFYFLYEGLFIGLNTQFVVQDWYLLMITVLSFVNYLIFKRSFYNKLRIKARIY